MAAAVVNLAGGVPEEDVVVKQDDVLVTETWESLKKTCLEIKMRQVVTEPRDCLNKT
jgi:hypothetical protein